MEFKRVANIVSKFCTGGVEKCHKCPLSYENNGLDMGCRELMLKKPEEYERIVTELDEKGIEPTDADKGKLVLVRDSNDEEWYEATFITKCSDTFLVTLTIHDEFITKWYQAKLK